MAIMHTFGACFSTDQCMILEISCRVLTDVEERETFMQYLS